MPVDTAFDEFLVADTQQYAVAPLSLFVKQ